MSWYINCGSFSPRNLEINMILIKVRVMLCKDTQHIPNKVYKFKGIQWKSFGSKKVMTKNVRMDFGFF